MMIILHAIHPRVSQKNLRQVEEIFGWMKTVERCRRLRCQGVEHTGLTEYLVVIAYSLLIMANAL